MQEMPRRVPMCGRKSWKAEMPPGKVPGFFFVLIYGDFLLFFVVACDTRTYPVRTCASQLVKDVTWPVMVLLLTLRARLEDTTTDWDNVLARERPQGIMFPAEVRARRPSAALEGTRICVANDCARRPRGEHT